MAPALSLESVGAMAHSRHVFIIFAILAVLCACCVAQESIHRPSFRDVLQGRTAAGPKAFVASVQAGTKRDVKKDTAKPSQESGDYEGYQTEEKEVCLQEVSRRGCTGLWSDRCDGVASQKTCQINNELWT